jgi:hypothetical protein
MVSILLILRTYFNKIADEHALMIIGLLLTLMFPIDGDREGGPPYSVSPELYDSLLGDNFERVYFGKPAPSDVKDGREMMGVFKRK